VRTLSYAQAIREAHIQALQEDPSVFVIGQGLWSPWYVGSSMKDLDIMFGRERIIDSPVSENGVTGAAVGAAMVGMRPLVVHPRMDFMLLAIDQLVNQAANWYYMTGGRVSVPVTIRAIVNRGGEQAAQHSQSVHAWFMHVPGLKVVMPATAHDAKGLLIAALRDDNPVVYIDDRWLYSDEDDVPEESYEVPIGKAAVRRPGKDVTIVANSVMARESLKAASALAERGVDAEVIDLRTIRPLDKETILASVARTGRLVTADGGWLTGGVGSEIAALVASEAYPYLRAPVARVALPEAPAPMSRTLEEAFYPTSAHIERAVERVLDYVPN
jgi:acetoin:2,6-dichlorophenolindophenol oxidoreductase subunit beta